MVDLGIGKVIDIIDITDQIQIIKIKHSKGDSRAIHYLLFHPPLNIGDRVVINQTSSSLQLGTGGYDFIVTPLNPQFHAQNNRKKGHIMKLRYTPYQFSIQSCEEQNSQYHDLFKEPKMLSGLPVLIGELHSMLPIIITIFRQLEKRYLKKESNIVYIMTDGAALPLAFSKHISQLKKLGWLKHTITVGQAFGGDSEAVNIYTGLIAAKYIYNADFVIVLMGPGIVGTGTLLGHTGVEQGMIINAVSSLEGLPVSIVRASLKDERDRHKGISHHTLSSLKYISLVKSIVPYPEYILEKYPQIYNELEKELNSKHELTPVIINHNEVIEFLKSYPYPITTMGRSIEEDPLFFDFVASSAYWLYKYLSIRN